MSFINVQDKMELMIVIVSQVQNFLKKIQSETQKSPCDQSEIEGGSTQEAKFLFLREEEKKTTEVTCEDGGHEAAVEDGKSSFQSCSDAKRSTCSNPAAGTVDSEEDEEEEEEEHPGRPLRCLKIPDFLLSDTRNCSSSKSVAPFCCPGRTGAV